MPLNHKLYYHKKKLTLLSIVLFFIGILISIYFYGIEPWETIGGFICGASLGMFLMFLFLKKD